MFNSWNTRDKHFRHVTHISIEYDAWHYYQSVQNQTKKYYRKKNRVTFLYDYIIHGWL